MLKVNKESSEMSGHRLLSKVGLTLLVSGAVAGTVWTRVSQPVDPMQPVIPTQMITAVPVKEDAGGIIQPEVNDFTATLHSGVAEIFVLGPCVKHGGYVVDVTPLEGSVDGAHIEQRILPEFDGEIWVDVLTLTIPERVSPLPVRVEVYSTADWPRAFQQTLMLNPGDWSGFIIQDSSVAAGYVIEINPLSAGEFGDRIEKALVQPEFPPPIWWDVLRLQIPVGQGPLDAEVIVYQTPSSLPVVLESELVAEPGVWHGLAIGSSQEGGAYIVEVTPLVYEDNQVERYTVQPEYNGMNWNDVLRLMVPADRPPMALRVTVYLAGGG
jgi:hypothetical protein